MDKEKVIQQLANAWAITDIREDELTTSEVREALKEVGSRNSREFVSRKMSSLVEQEILQRREVRVVGGGRKYAYSPAEGKTWEDVLQYIKVN